MAKKKTNQQEKKVQVKKKVQKRKKEQLDVWGSLRASVP